MKLTKDQVKHVANLSRLQLSEEDLEHFSKDLTSIIQYVEKLNELDTSGVTPTFQTIPLKNVLREDEVKESMTTEQLLHCAPDHDSYSIRVPKIIDIEAS